MAGAGKGGSKAGTQGARLARVRAGLRKAREPEPDSAASGPVANIILADIALRGGTMLLRTAVNRGVQAIGGAAKPRFGQKLVTTTLAKVATRSVPGAIVIGGGLLAKTLYDRARSRKKPVTNSNGGEDGGE
ncbi:MAG: hypothetical protein KGL48_08660 [Sphingomonadales bacterium]|nr:hypothetical protein [Sphingomonadales bacterium]MDE2568214.1 hypothetical protein [Sphingomonadales bacterium]